MKNAKQLFATALLVLTALPALHAQTITHTVRATIPFGFTVNGKTMTAGAYIVTSSDEKVITIKQVDGAGFAMALTSSARSLDPVESKLVFQRRGDNYYLSQVWMGNSTSGREFSRPADYRKLAQTHLMEIAAK
jgi:hypothetical protein